MSAESVLKDRTVLVADDDPSIRKSLVRLFKSYGVKVIEANDGQEALDILNARPGEVDALLTDNNMPRKTGRELALDVRNISPNFPIMILSADEPTALARIGSETNSVVMNKPSSGKDIMQALADLIAPQEKDNAMTPGGIELNAKKLEMDVSREGVGAAMSLDPALAEEFRRGDFSGVVPIILKITPVSGPAAVLGLSEEALTASSV